MQSDDGKSVINNTCNKSKFVINNACSTSKRKRKRQRRGRKGSHKHDKHNENKSTCDITIGFNNTRGCKSKLYEIKKLCYENNFNVFGMAETFHTKNDNLLVNGYSFVGKDRESQTKDRVKKHDGQTIKNSKNRNLKKGGGGVGFLIKNDVTIINDNVCNSKEDDYERLWVKIRYNNVAFYCAVAYFPVEGANPNLTNELHNQILSEVLQINDSDDNAHFVIMGDFNGKIGSYIPDGDPVINYNGQALLNFAEDSNTTILNCTKLCSGRWTWSRNDQRSILDYFLVSDNVLSTVKEMVVNDSGSQNIGSDHDIMYMKLNFSVNNDANKNDKNSNGRVYWDIKQNHDFSNFQTCIENVFQDFNVDDTQNANTIWLSWKTRLLHAAHESIGVKKFNGNQKPWYDKDIDQAIKKRQQSNQRHRQYLKSGENNKDVQDSLWNDYRSKQKDVKKLIREKAMQKRIDKCINISKKGGKSCKDFWKILKGPTQKDNLQVLKIPNSGVTTDDKNTIKTTVYQYWNTLGKMSLNLKGDEIMNTKELVNKLKMSHSHHDNNLNITKPILDQINFSIEDVAEVIRQSKGDKSPGIDNITNNLVKNAGNVLINCMYRMFNRFLEMESIPDEWNRGIIVPIHKKGDKADLNNYRGITLNSCIAKMYTKLITNNVSKFLENHDILSEIQGGFRADRRCEDHIFTLKSITSIRKLDRKNTFLAFLDFKKAFDSVWRDKLLLTAWEIGIRGHVFNVIKNLYDNVQSKVKFGDIETEFFEIDEGLKQGCGLSPILFCIYINELARMIRHKNLGVKINDSKIGCLFWADDVVLIGDNENDLNELLDVASEFSHKFKLNFNFEKSNVLITGKRVNNERKWRLGNSFIKETKDYKYLGTYFSRSLSDHVHIEDAIRKGNRLIAYIKSIINNQDDFNRVYYGDLLWKTIALPTINYACAIWTHGSESDRNKIENLQFQMARTILRANRNTAKEALYGELGWQPLSAIQTNCRVKYFDRLLNMSNDRYSKMMFDAMFCKYKIDGKCTQWKWFKQIEESLIYCGLDHIFTNNIPHNMNWYQTFKTIKIELDDKQWFENASGKKTLSNYCLFKNKPTLENYLLDATDFYGSSLKFKIRTNTLPLEFNTKSWFNNNSNSAGLCKLCSNDFETSTHFLFDCKAFNEIRSQELLKLELDLHANDFYSFWQWFHHTRDETEKYFFMMDNLFCVDKTLGNIFDKFCKSYIKRAWKRRTDLINNDNNS